MQIMPDIPENRRGLNHWANPAWLSVRNRQLNYSNECVNIQGKKVKSRGRDRKGINRTAIIITWPDGDKHEYKSRTAAAAAIGFTGSSLSVTIYRKIRDGVRLPNGDVQFKTRKGLFTVAHESLSEKEKANDS